MIDNGYVYQDNNGIHYYNDFSSSDEEVTKKKDSQVRRHSINVPGLATLNMKESIELTIEDIFSNQE